MKRLSSVAAKIIEKAISVVGIDEIAASIAPLILAEIERSVSDSIKSMDWDSLLYDVIGPEQIKKEIVKRMMDDIRVSSKQSV